MKKVIRVIGCVWSLIKKIFSKCSKTDISHDCKEALEFIETPELSSENIDTEEYLDNYKVTTRWQTV